MQAMTNLPFRMPAERCDKVTHDSAPHIQGGWVWLAPNLSFKNLTQCHRNAVRDFPDAVSPKCLRYFSCELRLVKRHREACNDRSTSRADPVATNPGHGPHCRASISSAAELIVTRNRDSNRIGLMISANDQG